MSAASAGSGSRCCLPRCNPAYGSPWLRDRCYWLGATRAESCAARAVRMGKPARTYRYCRRVPDPTSQVVRRMGRAARSCRAALLAGRAGAEIARPPGLQRVVWLHRCLESGSVVSIGGVAPSPGGAGVCGGGESALATSRPEQQRRGPWTRRLVSAAGAAVCRSKPRSTTAFPGRRQLHAFADEIRVGSPEADSTEAQVAPRRFELGRDMTISSIGVPLRARVLTARDVSPWALCQWRQRGSARRRRT